jgi:alkylation response protein AidB-like acyl-CoA dehydrogenase
VTGLACDLNHSEDQRQILAAAAAMLNASYPVARRRADGPDDLSAIAAFGGFGLALPEDRGGAGFTLLEEALLHVLFGRHLVSTRALATSLACRLAAACGREDMAEQLVGGASGVCAALPSGSSFLLIDPQDATVALVFGERRLTLIDLHGPKEQLTGLGHSVPVSRFRPGAPTVIGESADAALLDIADLLVSAQLLGVAEAARDLALSYAQVRQQFGRPIGSFQAIKHHCADMTIATEMVSSLLDMAALAVRDGRGDAAFQVAALRRLAPRAAISNARTCIQIHGGIGFSAEADAHHYLKQAHLLSRLGNGAPVLDQTAPLAPHQTLEERN